jgi:hypothetical protein
MLLQRGFWETALPPNRGSSHAHWLKPMVFYGKLSLQAVVSVDGKRMPLAFHATL